MCGIAGLIHRDGATSVGQEMTAMLRVLAASRSGFDRLCHLRLTGAATNTSCA